VLDLFSGCGGLALGFHRAGYRIIGGIEIDATASRTFAANLLRWQTRGDRTSQAEPIDITLMPPQRYEELALGGSPSQDVDVIVGGPPCQSFARIGRAKLREVMNHQKAHLRDGRANLYHHFLNYVDYFRPRAVLLENVPDIMNFGGRNVAEEIALTLEDLGYIARYSVLNSAHYGVPQLRPRLYLIGLRSDLGAEPSFPRPTHFFQLPKGYMDAQRASLKQYPLFDGALHYVDAPSPNQHLPTAITVLEAIGDLPPIREHLSREIKGPRRFQDLTPYSRAGRASAYSRKMKSWRGFQGGQGLYDHVIRYLPRDHRIFRQMEQGDQYPEAHRIAEGLFLERLARIARKDGKPPRAGSTEYQRLKEAVVPPYDAGKFPNKWRKLIADAPSHTLTAHMGKDTYSHIHYDSAQARVISVREAARLQSFPDGFRFMGAMNAAFRQIGNAVPPLQAYALAMEIRKTLVTRGRKKKPGE
jgi:DNA (cytosine-5)-methyltransferase 1